MYEFIRGKLIEITPIYAVIESQGIGYKILVPVDLIGKGMTPGKEALLYTSWVIRENSSQLFGFLEKEERNLFELLISFSGIGPKTGLAIIGHFNVQDLNHTVNAKNPLPLTKVPGVGKKTAERLIVDLKGKLEKFTFSQKALPTSSQKIQDAAAALINLGYSPELAHAAIQSAIEEVSPDCDLSTLISKALKSKRK